MERLASLFSHYQILFEISNEEYIKHNNSARAMGETIEVKYGKKHAFLPSILKTHFQEKSVVPAGSSPVILVMLEMR